MNSETDAYDEVCAYTLTHGDPSFIHQHVVDAFVVQHANAQTKPIALTFGLVGLFLKIEKGFSGRRVQIAHMDLAKNKEVWPTFEFPADRGSVTSVDVFLTSPGPARDKAIDDWCASVWKAWVMNREKVRELLERRGIIRR